MNLSDALESLRSRLASTSAGKLAGQDKSRVEGNLAQCWDDLEGSNEGGMQWSKLIGRTENLRWDPPILKFQIERHGGRMLGSTRAELQTWDINVIHGTARIVATGHRQLEQMEARLDVKPLASETAAMIVDGRESPWLKWASPTRVRIIIAEVIPATNKQTTAGRRKRFVAALDPLLGPQGWRRTKAGSHLVFERTTEG